MHASYMPEVFNKSFTSYEVGKIKEIIKNKFPTVSYIAGSGVSGITMASMVSFATNINLLVVRKHGDDTHSSIFGKDGKYAQRICEFDEDEMNNRTAIIIDDLISSGSTINRMIHEMKVANITVIGIILYHDNNYDGDLFGKDELAIPVYSTSMEID